MTSLRLICLVFAFVCFLLAAFNVPTPFVTLRLEAHVPTGMRGADANIEHIALVAAPVFADAICWNASLDTSLFLPNIRQAAESWEKYRKTKPSGRGRVVMSANANAAERRLALSLKDFPNQNPHNALWRKGVR